jgi:hypothetical protein
MHTTMGRSLAEFEPSTLQINKSGRTRQPVLVRDSSVELRGHAAVGELHVEERFHAASE